MHAVRVRPRSKPDFITGLRVCGSKRRGAALTPELALASQRARGECAKRSAPGLLTHLEIFIALAREQGLGRAHPAGANLHRFAESVQLWRAPAGHRVACGRLPHPKQRNT
jgi:hypothetical protein